MQKAQRKLYFNFTSQIYFYQPMDFILGFIIN